MNKTKISNCTARATFQIDERFIIATSRKNGRFDVIIDHNITPADIKIVKLSEHQCLENNAKAKRIMDFCTQELASFQIEYMNANALRDVMFRKVMIYNN